MDERPAVESTVMHLVSLSRLELPESFKASMRLNALEVSSIVLCMFEAQSLFVAE